jgi:hypothetical protein
MGATKSKSDNLVINDNVNLAATASASLGTYIQTGIDFLLDTYGI